MRTNHDIPSVRVIARIPKNAGDRTAETEDVLCIIRHFSAELLVETLKNEDHSTRGRISALPEGKNVEDSILISLDQIISIVPEIQHAPLRKDSI